MSNIALTRVTNIQGLAIAKLDQTLLSTGVKVFVKMSSELTTYTSNIPFYFPPTLAIPASHIKFSVFSPK